MQYLGYLLLRGIVELFRFVPFPVLYALSDGLAFFLARVLGYRRQVVSDNLRRAFPEKTEAERAALARRSYQNLTDVTLETLKSHTLSLAEATRRCRPLNPELLNQYLDEGRAVILCGSHLGNWEYSGLSMPPMFHGSTVTAYKPMSNKYIDAFTNRGRSRTGMEMMSMDDTFRVMRQRGKQACVFILLSDQSPSSPKSAHWVELFGIPTATLPGADVLARKFQFPVLYYFPRRVRRGFYEIQFSTLCPDPAGLPDMEITRRYTRQLEADILANPEQWLWSHRRWKMTRSTPDGTTKNTENQPLAP